MSYETKKYAEKRLVCAHVLKEKKSIAAGELYVRKICVILLPISLNLLLFHPLQLD